jgi:glycosyltransferase involved in cell wall biosynthesis
MNRKVDLSLIICTRNRAAQLAETLKRVATIRSRLSWELIVTDNGSTDRTNEVVRDYAAVSERPVRGIFMPGRGVSYARNAGWQAAESDVVTYIDDDCYPAEDYLDAVFECFSRDPRVGFVGGRILLHDPSDRRITIQESL